MAASQNRFIIFAKENLSQITDLVRRSPNEATLPRAAGGIDMSGELSDTFPDPASTVMSEDERDDLLKYLSSALHLRHHQQFSVDRLHRAVSYVAVNAPKGDDTAVETEPKTEDAVGEKNHVGGKKRVETATKGGEHKGKLFRCNYCYEKMFTRIKEHMKVCPKGPKSDPNCKKIVDDNISHQREKMEKLCTNLIINAQDPDLKEVMTKVEILRFLRKLGHVIAPTRADYLFVAQKVDNDDVGRDIESEFGKTMPPSEAEILPVFAEIHSPFGYDSSQQHSENDTCDLDSDSDSNPVPVKRTKRNIARRLIESSDSERDSSENEDVVEDVAESSDSDNEQLESSMSVDSQDSVTKSPVFSKHHMPRISLTPKKGGSQQQQPTSTPKSKSKKKVTIKTPSAPPSKSMVNVRTPPEVDNDDRFEQTPVVVLDNILDESTESVNRPKERNWRSGVQKSLKDIGFYSVPDDFSNLQVFVDYKAHLNLIHSKKHLTTNNFLNVLRMLWHMSKPNSETFSLDILNQQKLTEFLEAMNGCNVDPQTKLNYIKSLKSFLKYFSSCSKLLSRSQYKYRCFTQFQSYTDIVMKKVQTEMALCVKEKKAKAELPPTPNEVNAVVYEGKDYAKNLLQEAETRSLGKYEVTYLNRYLGAYTCLLLSHRPCVIENLMIDDYIHALRNNVVVVDDETFLCITVTRHKTGLQYAARITLDSEFIEIFDKYNRFVRNQIIRETGTDCKHFCLQKDGHRFQKFSEGVTKLQDFFNLPRVKVGDSRKSTSQYSQLYPQDVQKNIANHLCHSEMTRDKHYRIGDTRQDVAYLKVKKGMTDFYEGKGRQVLSKAVPSDPTSGECVEPQPSTSQRREPPTPPPVTTGRRPPPPPQDTIYENSGENSAPARPPPPRPSRLPSSSPLLPSRLPTAPTVPPRHENEHPPKIKTPLKRKAPVKSEELCRSISAKLRDGGSLANVEIPSVGDLRTEYNLSPKKAVETRRKLRYLREKDIIQDLAEKFINKEKRRLKPNQTLDSIPQIREIDVDRENYGIKIDIQKVKRRMQEMLSFNKNTEIKLEDLLESQKWPNLDIISVPGKGEGVFTRDRTYHKGQVVCDYHGIHRNKKDAEVIAQNMEGGAGNYMFYYRNQKGESKCVDASTYPCGCHDLSFGRWINHSCKKDNLTPTLKMVDGKNHILLIAKVDIPPNTELLFNYGVTCGLNKEKISWLKE